MASKELGFPVSATNVAVPAATDTVVLTFATPGTTQSRTLSDPGFVPAAGSTNSVSGGVVIRGVIILTGNAVAGTVTVKIMRNGNQQVDSTSSQPLTLAAGQVIAIPFEFTDRLNPQVNNQWFYTITVNPSQAGTVNKAYGHIWAEG